MQVVLYTVSIPKVLTVNNIWLAVFLLSLHFKDNTVCVIEHISLNSVGLFKCTCMVYMYGVHVASFPGPIPSFQCCTLGTRLYVGVH